MYFFPDVPWSHGLISIALLSSSGTRNQPGRDLALFLTVGEISVIIIS